MPEDQKSSEDELFGSEVEPADSEGSEGGSDPLVPAEGAEEKEANKADKDRTAQVTAWEAKIKRGDATLEDIPERQKWIRDALTKEVKPKLSDDEIDRKIDSKLKAQADELEYIHLKKTLSEKDLTKKQKSEIAEEYDDLLKAGLPKAKALEKAMRMAGAHKTVTLESKRIKMSIPKPGSPEQTEEIEIDDDGNYPKSIPESKRLALLEKLRKEE